MEHLTNADLEDPVSDAVCKSKLLFVIITERIKNIKMAPKKYGPPIFRPITIVRAVF